MVPFYKMIVKKTVNGNPLISNKIANFIYIQAAKPG